MHLLVAGIYGVTELLEWLFLDKAFFKLRETLKKLEEKFES